MRKTIVVSVIFYSITALVYFLSAGRIDLPLAWIYFVSNAVIGLVTVAIAESKSPGFAQERLRPAPGEQDRLFKPVGTVCSTLLLVIAGLDVGRFHWVPTVDWRLQMTGLLLDLLGLLLVCWPMLVNSYFSSAVRLQPDRAQVLVTSGPYRFVRHPGYTGGILYLGLNGLALGSGWAGLPAIPMVILTLRRTALEDAMLQKGLPGYAEYSKKVRYRILPGIW